MTSPPHLCFRSLRLCVEKTWSSRASVCTSLTQSPNTIIVGKWWIEGALGLVGSVRAMAIVVVGWAVGPVGLILGLWVWTQPWWLLPRQLCRAVGGWWACWPTSRVWPQQPAQPLQPETRPIVLPAPVSAAPAQPALAGLQALQLPPTVALALALAHLWSLSLLAGECRCIIGNVFYWRVFLLFN